MAAHPKSEALLALHRPRLAPRAGSAAVISDSAQTPPSRCNAGLAVITLIPASQRQRALANVDFRVGLSTSPHAAPDHPWSKPIEAQGPIDSKKRPQSCQ